MAAKVDVQFRAETGQMDRAMAKLGNPAGLSKLTAGVGKLVGVLGLAAAASKALDLGKKAVSDAADLEQSVGAIDAVFKGSAKQMHAWSNSAATSVGLSKNEYNELGTLIGSQLKNGGTAMTELAGKSNDLIKTGADLSSMFGGTTREAVEALSSALKGERDPIERYGVTLNQAKIDAEAASLGFKKVNGAWSTQAQQAATLSLITKQTADAQGNFARESDTAAHKLQVLKAKGENISASLGTKLLPAWVAVLDLLDKSLGPIVQAASTAWQAMTPYLAQVGSALTGLGAAAAPVLASLMAGWSGIASTWLPIIQQIVQGVQGVMVPAFHALGASIMTNVFPAFRGLIATIAQVHATVAPIVQQIVTTVVGHLRTLQPQINAVMTQIGQIVGQVMALISAIVQRILPVVQAFWARWGSTILSVTKTVMTTIMGVIRGSLNVVQGIVRTVLALVRGDWSGAWAGVKQIVSGAMGIVRSVISGGMSAARSLVSGAMSAVRSGISSAMSSARSSVSSAMSSIRSGVSSAMGTVLGTVRRLPGQIVGALGGMASRTYSIGLNIIQGMVNGVRGAAGSLVSAASSAVSGAIAAAKSKLGIRSPSRVFAYFGDMTMQGLAQGITRNASDAVRAADRAVAGVVSAGSGASIPTPAMSASGRAGARDGVTINLTVPMLDPSPENVRRLVELLRNATRQGVAFA